MKIFEPFHVRSVGDNHQRA